MIPWFADLADFEAFLAERVDTTASLDSLGGIAWRDWPAEPKARRIIEAYDYLRAGPFTLPGPEGLTQAAPELRGALALFAYRITHDPVLLDTIATLASQARVRANWNTVQQTATLVKIFGVRTLALLAPYRRDPNAGLDLF